MPPKHKPKPCTQKKNNKIKTKHMESQPSTSGVISKKRKSNDLHEDNIKKSKLSTPVIIENEENQLEESASKKNISISDLNPFQSRWIITARILSKKQIYVWKNAKSSGKLFSIDLTDKSGQIRAIVFNELVDKFYDKVQCDKVYHISDADLREANKKYSVFKNKFEIVFTNDTILEECSENSDEIPKIEYNFKSIPEILKLSLNSVFNSIGICHEIKALEEITAKKSGKIFKKRDITIIDASRNTITVTVWNQLAENFDESNVRSVVILMNVRLSEYGKKYLSLNQDSELKINDTLSEAIQLKKWYETQNNDEIKNVVKNAELFGVENMKIEDILKLPPKSNFNTIAICYDISDLKSFISPKPTQNELYKRTITLINQALKPIICTLWNSEARAFGLNYIDTIVSIKNGIIAEKNNLR